MGAVGGAETMTQTTIPENLRGYSRAELLRRAALLEDMAWAHDRPRWERDQLIRHAQDMRKASKHAQ